LAKFLIVTSFLRARGDENCYFVLPMLLVRLVPFTLPF
jgi:hypothetical protein